jgi:hypothetical protein
VLSRLPITLFETGGAKVIDLGIQLASHKVALVIQLTTQASGSVDIRLRVYPTGDSIYLPLKAHCYFGLKPNSKTPDCLEHLKCFMGYYGGSTGVLKFLLKELGL